MKPNSRLKWPRENAFSKTLYFFLLEVFWWDRNMLEVTWWALRAEARAHRMCTQKAHTKKILRLAKIPLFREHNFFCASCVPIMVVSFKIFELSISKILPHIFFIVGVNKNRRGVTAVPKMTVFYPNCTRFLWFWQTFLKNADFSKIIENVGN